MRHRDIVMRIHCSSRGEISHFLWDVSRKMPPHSHASGSSMWWWVWLGTVEGVIARSREVMSIMVVE